MAGIHAIYVRSRNEMCPKKETLLAILEHNPLSKSEFFELAHRYGVGTPGTVEPYLEEIKKRKMVAEKKDLDDQRIRWIELTAAGKAYLNKLKEAWKK